MSLGLFSVRDTGVFREILDDDEWGVEQELTQPTFTWSNIQNQNWEPEKRSRSSSDALRIQRPEESDTTFDLILNCSLPDPGFHQWQFWDIELNGNVFNFEQSYFEP